MAVTGSGQLASAAVSQSSTEISKTRAGILQVSISGLTNPSACTIVLGEKTSSGAPATYGALANTTDLATNDANWSNATFRQVAFSNYSFQGVWNGSVADPSWTNGHFAWVAVFDHASPSSGDAPAFVVGPRTIVA